MTNPAPFVTPDTDINGLDSFMLNVDRLMTSELWALSTGDEFKAALALWCRAWKQRPAGSLPNDERILAAFSGAGGKWRRIREMALRGFVECSDGRLYHRTLCEDVLRASTLKEQRREQTRAANEARRAQRNGECNNDKTCDVTSDVTKSHRRDVTETRQESSLRSEEISPPKRRATNGKEPPGFAEFYATFPIHKGRTAAAKAYGKAAQTVSPSDLLDGATRYAAERKNEDQKFTMHPATWLNAGCWADEPVQGGGGSGLVNLDNL